MTTGHSPPASAASGPSAEDQQGRRRIARSEAKGVPSRRPEGGAGKQDAAGYAPPESAATAPAKEYTVVVAVRPAPDGKEFLMVEHRDRGWELPGGKIEAGEGPVHCALREFREETGHLLASPRFVVKLRKPNGTCYVFTGGLGPQVGGAQDEVVGGMRWFSRLPRGERLAFPDDPYAEIGAHLGIEFG